MWVESHMQKTPTQTYLVCKLSTQAELWALTQKQPHIILRASPEEHPAVSLNEYFSSSLASEQLYCCCMGTLAVDNNVLYQQKLIIILFWYSYIAWRGAISFLIKTNCLSSTEFFLQLFNKSKYVLIFTTRCLSLPFFHSSLSLSVGTYMGFFFNPKYIWHVKEHHACTF